MLLGHGGKVNAQANSNIEAKADVDISKAPPLYRNFRCISLPIYIYTNIYENPRNML